MIDRVNDVQVRMISYYSSSRGRYSNILTLLTMTKKSEVMCTTCFGLGGGYSINQRRQTLDTSLIALGELLINHKFSVCAQNDGSRK